MFNYNKIYKKNKSVWGNKVNFILRKALKFLKVKQGLKALDLGCGQGKEVFFLSKIGFKKVVAVDSSKNAIEQIKEKARKNRLPIKAICSNVTKYKIKRDEYDLIAGMDVLQFLNRREIISLIKNIKIGLRDRGIIALSTFTTKDPSRLTRKKLRYYFKPNELKSYFKDFKILYYEKRIILDPGHASSPYLHKHGIAEIIARKNL